MRVLTTLITLVSVFHHVGAIGGVMPPTILVGPQQEVKYLREGETVTLTCSVWGIPTPSIKWLKNGRDLDLNSANIHWNHTAKEKITIKDIGPSGENFQCSVDNIYGVELSNITRLEKACNVAGGKNEAIKKIEEGQSFYLNINMECLKPYGTHTWSVVSKKEQPDGTKVSRSRRIQIDDQGNLHFAFATMDDSRRNMIYKSETYNQMTDSSVGSSYTRVAVKKNDFISHSAPRLAFSSPAEVIVLEDEKLILRCFFYGNPEPEYEWEGPGNMLPTGRYSYMEDQTMLVIERVVSGDAGQYRCTGRNSEGDMDHRVLVIVEAPPRFSSESNFPQKMNVTEGKERVTFTCDAYGVPNPTHTWIINGKPLDLDNLPPKMSLSTDLKRLSIRSPCKLCGHSFTDLRVVQCNVSNTHGYLLKTGYLNVINKTRARLIGDSPDISLMDRQEASKQYQCSATSDPTTPVTVRWSRLVSVPTYSFWFGTTYGEETYERVSTESNNVVVREGGILVLHRKKNDSKTWSKFASKFKCQATNGYSSDEKFVNIHVVDAPQQYRSGVLDWWWLLLLLFLLLLLVILLIFGCRWLVKNKGDEYDVDAKEKLNGNEPEKELVNHGFKTYRRPDNTVYVKGSRQSLGSSDQTNSDEDGSLNDYGLVDGGKFNEDGSFVGAYNIAPRSGQIRAKNVHVLPARMYT